MEPLALNEGLVVVPKGDVLAIYSSDYANGVRISQGRAATSSTKLFLNDCPVDESVHFPDRALGTGCAPTATTPTA